MRCIRQWIVRHRDTVDHARGHVIVFVIPGYGNNSGIPQSFDDGQFFRYWSKPGIGNSLAWPLRFSKFLTQGDRTWNMTLRRTNRTQLRFIGQPTWTLRLSVQRRLPPALCVLRLHRRSGMTFIIIAAIVGAGLIQRLLSRV